MQLLLASASPRRQQLLQLLERPFEVILPQVAEQRQPNEVASAYVQRLALSKAQAGLGLAQGSGHSADYYVIGADTIVVAGQQVLEKPQDFADFCRMMELLSGQVHEVMTAVAVVDERGVSQLTVTTEVSFKTLTEAELAAYWASGEPHDKAGGYGIQGRAGKFVTQLRGSYSAVVGLPLYETEQLLLQREQCYHKESAQ
ncbi:Maf family protein [Pseudidiomarina mangrovi]|uniref:Maf family protein n=1 Tax=Pseudidiomarina mangrovi TaxID=2487133 RepID=UPI000FC9D830|nr:Maf family protein [Pseudidiomarina mangrovi]